jgi:trehalose 6-phosphate phosphatase
VAFLRPPLRAEIVISGLYGLEIAREGRVTDHPEAGTWRRMVDEAARASADQGPAGMDVEPKGLSLTLHYRRRPDLAAAVQSWAETQAARSGLEVRPAKMSFELHPPIEADKGTALEALVAGLKAVAYVGDDRGDLPAYDALDRLAATGEAATLRVAVASAEAPPDLLARADLVVDGPGAVVDLLRRLASGPDHSAAAS